MPFNVKVIASLVVSMVFWAFSFVWIKQAFESFNPLSVIWLRLVVSSIMMFTVLSLMKRLVRIHRADIKWFLLLAFFEPFLYFMGESFGLKYVPSTMGAVIVSTIPLFAPIADRIFFKARLTWINLAGISFSFIGVLLIILEDDFSLKAPIHGILLVFMAVFAAMGYSVVLKKVPARYNAVSIITFQNIIGIFYFFPLFVFYDWHHLTHTVITTNAVLAMVQLSIFASSLAFIFFTYGMRKVGITKANVFVNLIPVFTAVFAWMILGDPLTVRKVIGIAVVIGGLFVSQIKMRRI
ncbi:DMT family transporter [Marinilabiliaceae bacterium JC017]|nr:DMT family transporter [Marinilabiliaceae bacterium JC017]